jgi:hypothetical protein
MTLDNGGTGSIYYRCPSGILRPMEETKIIGMDKDGAGRHLIVDDAFASGMLARRTILAWTSRPSTVQRLLGLRRRGHGASRTGMSS